MDTPTTAGGSFQDELRQRVKEWVRRRNQKQSVLASECGVNDADLSNFLSGRRGLPAFALANLASELEMDAARLLLHWNALQCASEIGKLEARGTPIGSAAKQRGWARAGSAYERLLGGLPNTEYVQTSLRPLGTLIDWPHAFLPLVVFVGDRRETPPKSPADLLAVSASPGDLFYFPSLNLPAETEIRSDKTSVVAKQDNLRALFEDKNLLIIGSPAANLVARLANRGACFSFYATSDAMAQEEDFKRLLEPIRYLPSELERFADVNSVTPEHHEWSRRRRHMVYGFARSGILDPVHFEGARAVAPPAHADFGVVTLCRHPWSDTRVAIMAAGLHGPATAAAVKLLAQRDAFADRPLGGVFRVHVPIDAPWEERFHHLAPVWDTHAYSLPEFGAAVETFTEKYRADIGKQLRFWDPRQVQALLAMIAADQQAGSSQ